MRLTMNLGVKETFILKVNAWSFVVAYFHLSNNNVEFSYYRRW